MRTQIVYVKENGELKLTKEELEKLLDDAYNKGYTEGKSSITLYYPRSDCWNCPYKPKGITYTYSTNTSSDQNDRFIGMNGNVSTINCNSGTAEK